MYKNFLKIIFDLLLSLFVFVVFFIPGIIICFLIKMDSKGPIIFRQIRVGKRAQPFCIYKFRTMVENADKIGALSTDASDSRITRVGSWLRKTSLDELPQVMNILFGQMSFIGPRPDLPSQKSNYSDQEWKERVSVRPGITGLAQAKYRSSATHDQRLKADLFYVHNIGFLLDLKILKDTFLVVIFRRFVN